MYDALKYLLIPFWGVHDKAHRCAPQESHKIFNLDEEIHFRKFILCAYHALQCMLSFQKFIWYMGNGTAMVFGHRVTYARPTSKGGFGWGGPPLHPLISAQRPFWHQHHCLPTQRVRTKGTTAKRYMVADYLSLKNSQVQEACVAA